MPTLEPFSSERNPDAIEFPILVYHTDEGWVAQSLLTCTTAVADQPETALDEVVGLLSSELNAALRMACGNLDAALESIRCSAEDELWQRYFSGRAIELPHRRIDPSGHTVAPHQLAAA